MEAVKDDEEGYKIYIKDNIPLNVSDRKAFEYVGVEEKDIKDAKKQDPGLDAKIRNFMCGNFFDIRLSAR